MALLALMAAAMPIAFATWSALLNNFVIEMAGFDGADIGWLHTVREIPGFLAIGVIFIIIDFVEVSYYFNESISEVSLIINFPPRPFSDLPNINLLTTSVEYFRTLLLINNILLIFVIILHMLSI